MRMPRRLALSVQWAGVALVAVGVPAAWLRPLDDTGPGMVLFGVGLVVLARVLLGLGRTHDGDGEKLGRDPGQSPSFTLTCLDGESCAVYLEPWGTEYRLSADDAFQVYSGAVEIGYADDGIVVWFTDDDPVKVVTKDGTALAL